MTYTIDLSEAAEIKEILLPIKELMQQCPEKSREIIKKSLQLLLLKALESGLESEAVEEARKKISSQLAELTQSA